MVGASVAIKWVVDEEDSGQAFEITQFDLFSIELLLSECSNTPWKLVQRGQLAASVALAKFELLLAAEMTIVPARIVSRRALEFACELGHPSYDCLYLAAAELHYARLVTADARLLRKVASSPRASLAISLQEAAAN